MNDAPKPTELTATSSSRGWRLAAVLVAVSIVGLVVATRLGAPIPEPQPSPAATALAARQSPAAGPSAPPTPRATPVPLTRLPIAGDSDRFRDVPAGTRYVDDIPALIDETRVFRVHEALEAPLGSTLMIGGWFVRRECAETRRRRCALPTIADTRLDEPPLRGLATDWIAMDLRLSRSGAYIVWGRLESDPRCSIRRAGACQPRLHVGDIVWPI